MKFINIRELSKSPSKYIKCAHEESDVIITRNGHPYAVISRMDESEMEDYILAKHYDLEKQFKEAISAYETGETINARDLLNSINSETENDI